MCSGPSEASDTQTCHGRQNGQKPDSNNDFTDAPLIKISLWIQSGMMKKHLRIHLQNGFVLTLIGLSWAHRLPFNNNTLFP